MRLFALPLVAALLGIGCADPASAPPSSVPAETMQLLDALNGSALDAVFERFEAGEYRAVGVVTQTTNGQIVSRDTLERGWGPGDSIPQPVPNPLPPALSDDPPFTDPAVRDAFRVETRGDTLVDGVRFTRVEAVLTDTTREVGVRRVRGLVDPATNAVGAITVERRSDSAIFAEDSRVDARRLEGGAWRIETMSTTDVPLSDPTTVRAVWTVRPAR